MDTAFGRPNAHHRARFPLHAQAKPSRDPVCTAAFTSPLLNLAIRPCPRCLERCISRTPVLDRELCLTAGRTHVRSIKPLPLRTLHEFGERVCVTTLS
jgi:hypothetical protein